MIFSCLICFRWQDNWELVYRFGNTHPLKSIFTYLQVTHFCPLIILENVREKDTEIDHIRMELIHEKLKAWSWKLLCRTVFGERKISTEQKLYSVKNCMLVPVLPSVSKINNGKLSFNSWIMWFVKWEGILKQEDKFKQPICVLEPFICSYYIL